jgi:homoserine kinase
MNNVNALDILQAKKGRRMTVEIPGATSNLGAGLDTFGLALAIYCRLTFVLLEQNDPNIPYITFSGSVVSESLPEETGKLVYKILRELWQDNPQNLSRIRIHVDSEIPLGSGLGGGTAAILGALWADQVFKDLVPTSDDLLALATRWEGQGHSETFAASLMGNFITVAKCATTDQVVACQHRWPDVWTLLISVPPYRLNTKTSKSMLPDKVSFSDAMFNLQRTALMVSAVVSADERALKEALKDQLHEKYRALLVPELASLREALSEEPIHGCVLSGGGPSLLVIVDVNFKPYIKKKMEKWAQSQDHPPQIFDVEVDRKGLTTLSVQ